MKHNIKSRYQYYPTPWEDHEVLGYRTLKQQTKATKIAMYTEDDFIKAMILEEGY